MKLVTSSWVHQGRDHDLIIKEHKRVTTHQDPSECDAQVICQDGDIFYTKLLLYLMQPSLKCALEAQSGDIEPIVIIHPSVLVEDFINYYEGEKIIQSTPPLTDEESTQDVIDFNNTPSQVPAQLSEKTLFCEKCGIGFNSMKQLQAHQWRVHPSKSTLKIHKCSECATEFAHKFELTKHMFNHMPPTFVCNSCGKAFKRRKGLVAHYNTFHGTSINVLKCPQCPDTFKVKSNLTRHLANVHQGKKFTCGQCNASFSRQDSYKRHLILHK